MIKVSVYYEKDKISKVCIKGHAMYDVYGKDIVCAAVSSIATTTINNIITLDENACIYDTKDGELNISIKKDSEVAMKLVSNMLNMLKELQNTYPKNIKIGGLR